MKIFLETSQYFTCLLLLFISVTCLSLLRTFFSLFCCFTVVLCLCPSARSFLCLSLSVSLFLHPSPFSLLTDTDLKVERRIHLCRLINYVADQLQRVSTHSSLTLPLPFLGSSFSISVFSSCLFLYIYIFLYIHILEPVSYTHL